MAEYGEEFDEYIKEMERICKDMKNKINIKVFIDDESNINFLDKIQEICDKIKIETVRYENLDAEYKNFVGKFKLSPKIAIFEGDNFSGIRFSGIPKGLEIDTFLKSLFYASTKKTDLSTNSRKLLKKINKNIDVAVFTSPTCPYCRIVSETSIKLAIESRYIRTEIIDITDFPELRDRFFIQTVPAIYLSDDFIFEGFLTEEEFIALLHNFISDS